MQAITKRFCPVPTLRYLPGIPLRRNINNGQLSVNSVRGFSQWPTLQSIRRQTYNGDEVQSPSPSPSLKRRFVDEGESRRAQRRPAIVFVVPLQVENVGDVEYPAFWLRDNCQCSQCIHPDTRQRMVDTFSLPPSVKALDVKYDGSQVLVDWTDGHHGVYPQKWLSSHVYSSPSIQKKEVDTITFRPFETVRPDYKSLPTVSYENVMAREESVLEWLDNIRIFGFSMIEGVPVDPESTQKLLERISFIRPTHYGGFWDFTSDLTFKDTAYTSDGLLAHTDTTYFTDPARLQLFHMLSHTHGEGGASLLVDGFKAAQTLCKESSKNAHILRSIAHPFHASGNENVSIRPWKPVPVLQCRRVRSNELALIRWNNYDRAAKVDWDVKKQLYWYSAARHWDNIVRRSDMEVWLQLRPGTAMIFDNWRMLHGRSEFTGKRRMCGGYINNDDFMSRYRLLKYGRQSVLDKLGSKFPVDF